MLLAALAAGCAHVGGGGARTADAGAGAGAVAEPDLARRLQAVLPADALLLGEQHDAPAHHALAADTVRTLAADGRLAALVLEMAEAGRSTDALPAASDEIAVRQALQWDDKAWPWAAYGPAVMAAVRYGVPVRGGNLGRAALRPAGADTALDGLLPPAAVAAQAKAIRSGHCNLLPANEVQPMVRMQIARDRALARTAASSTHPGRTVLLLAGAGHVNRQIGVPRHLPEPLTVRTVRLQAAGAPDAAAGDFDAVWPTAAPPAPAEPHCATLRRQWGRPQPAR